jgi:hypothetical protein
MASKRKAPAEAGGVKALLEKAGKAVNTGTSAAGKAAGKSAQVAEAAAEGTARVVKRTARGAAEGAEKAVKKTAAKAADASKSVAKTVSPFSDEGPSSSKPPASLDQLVNPKRVLPLREGEVTGNGPVLYWVSRDQRSMDNWALLYAIEQAHKLGSPVAVIFNLVPRFLNAGARHFGFMLRGLRVMEKNLKEKNIPFFIVQVRVLLIDKPRILMRQKIAMVSNAGVSKKALSAFFSPYELALS